MTDIRPTQAERGSPQPGPSLIEAVEVAVRRIATAIVIGAGIVALGVYARPAPPRYEAFAAGGQIVRVDTRTGTIIGCEGNQTCTLILKRGQRLARKPKPDALPKPAAATPLPAAPAAEK